jgi:hypothetical protein
MGVVMLSDQLQLLYIATVRLLFIDHTPQAILPLAESIAVFFLGINMQQDKAPVYTYSSEMQYPLKNHFRCKPRFSEQFYCRSDFSWDHQTTFNPHLNSDTL